MNFVDELKWRGMIHDIMPTHEELLAKGQTTAYVGIDPTADSLHVGHLVSVMMMKHFSRWPEPQTDFYYRWSYRYDRRS